MNGRLLPPALLLLAFTALSLLRFYFSSYIHWTWIPDEAWYASSAQSFYESFRLMMNGRFNSHTLPLYSIIISPAYYFEDMATTFAAIKLINSLVMTSTLIPVYLLAKKFLLTRNALIVACLSVIIGPMFYTFTIMSESLHYPLTAWAVYLMVRSLSEDNALAASIWLGIVFALSVLTKMSSLALVISYALLVLSNQAVRCWRTSQRGPYLRQLVMKYGPVVIIFVVIVSLYLIYRVTQADRASAIPYSGAWAKYFQDISNFHTWEYLKWFIIYIGQLNLSTGLCSAAPAVLMILALFKSTSRKDRTLAQVSCLVGTVVLALATLQSGYSDGRLTERHFFFLTPLIFILFAIWAERGRQAINKPFLAIGTLSMIAFSVVALYARTTSLGPACDSALADTLNTLLYRASHAGIAPYALKMYLSLLICILTFLTVTFSTPQTFRFWAAFIALFMITISVAPYLDGTKHAHTLRKMRLPIISWLKRSLPNQPVNLVLLDVNRDVALDHVVWNRDCRSRILWQARPSLANPSPYKPGDFTKIGRYIDPPLPMYIVSPFFTFAEAAIAGTYAGIDLYRVMDPEKVRINSFHIDFGELYDRSALRTGWSANEGPYPEQGFPSFVWAIGHKSELETFIEETKRSKLLSFRVRSYTLGQVMTILLNESQIQSLNISSTWQEYEVLLPREALLPGPNRLEFHFKNAIAPSDSGRPDKRKLAIAFDWLSIETGFP